MHDDPMKIAADALAWEERRTLRAPDDPGATWAGDHLATARRALVILAREVERLNAQFAAERAAGDGLRSYVSSIEWAGAELDGFDRLHSVCVDAECHGAPQIKTRASRPHDSWCAWLKAGTDYDSVREAARKVKP